MTGDSGKCPQCDKFQHWAPFVLKKDGVASLHKGLDMLQNVLILLSLAVGVAIIVEIISLFTNPELAVDGLWDNILKIVLFILLIAGCSFGYRLINRKCDREREMALAEREKLERKNPYFVTWTGEPQIRSMGYRKI
jgi:hypothetical protein